MHLSGTYDGNSVKIYLDGVLIDETSNDGEIDTSGNTPGIGGRASGDLPYNGKLDDVRIYETALTSVQVEALYYAGLDNLYTKGLIDKQEYRERILATNK
jgi:large repetitive protein